MEKKQHELERWVAFMVRGDLGYTYIRLYADAPAWVRDQVVNHFGRGTVFLPPEQARSCAA